jgi:predicted dehydrogenase
VAILEAERRSGKRYMMMETMVFSREFLYVKELVESGELGELTFLRGVHIQDLEGFARYWWGYPPMHYITHAISPLIAIAGAPASLVSCFGSGRHTDEMRAVYGNPFPLETAHFRFAGTDLAAEVTVAFNNTARPYTEGFSVYGERRSFEWGQRGNDVQLVYEFLPHEPGRRGRSVATKALEAPNRPELLPRSLVAFTETTSYTAPGGRTSVTVRNDHGSSHPHLVHEFITSIAEDRPSRVPGWLSANFTSPGIAAHRSALAGGELTTIVERSP